MRFWLFQIISQGRLAPSPSIRSSKVEGTPITFDTSRQAPVGERLRTMQSITELLLLNTILPARSMRVRWLWRCSGMACAPSGKRAHYGSGNCAGGVNGALLAKLDYPAPAQAEYTRLGPPWGAELGQARVRVGRVAERSEAGWGLL